MQKPISVVLLFVILLSTTGVQCSIHQCMKNLQESKAFFFAENSHNCCAEEAEIATRLCCETSGEKVETCCNEEESNQDNLQPEQCCNTNVYFFKLNTNALSQEQKSELYISSLFLAAALIQPFQTLSLQSVLLTEKYNPPDIISKGKYLCTLYSQFRI